MYIYEYECECICICELYKYNPYIIMKDKNRSYKRMKNEIDT